MKNPVFTLLHIMEFVSECQLWSCKKKKLFVGHERIFCQYLPFTSPLLPGPAKTHKLISGARWPSSRPLSRNVAVLNVGWPWKISGRESGRELFEGPWRCQKAVNVAVVKIWWIYFHCNNKEQTKRKAAKTSSGLIYYYGKTWTWEK